MKLITPKECNNSLQVTIDGYLFLVQFQKGNNVVMEKCQNSKVSFIEAIKKFIEFCRKRNILYLTVESRNGSDIYYKIAQRYFPNDEYFLDEKVLRIKLTNIQKHKRGHYK